MVGMRRREPTRLWRRRRRKRRVAQGAAGSKNASREDPPATRAARGRERREAGRPTSKQLRRSAGADDADRGHSAILLQRAGSGKPGRTIVAAEVTRSATDVAQLVPMTEAVERTTGEKPDLMVADRGYLSRTCARTDALSRASVPGRNRQRRTTRNEVAEAAAVASNGANATIAVGSAGISFTKDAGRETVCRDQIRDAVQTILASRSS
jgi:hypothetical protein